MRLLSASSPNAYRAIAEDEHAQHQLEINRRSTEIGIVIGQLSMDPRRVKDGCNLAYEMIARHSSIEIEGIE